MTMNPASHPLAFAYACARSAERLAATRYQRHRFIELRAASVKAFAAARRGGEGAAARAVRAAFASDLMLTDPGTALREAADYLPGGEG
jgi:hypothetical protein